MKLASILAPLLAATVFATGAFGSTANADTTTPTTAAAAPVAVEHTVQRAIDAFRTVLDRMVDGKVISPAQRDAAIDAAVKADWDGFSVERLGDILRPLVANDTLTATQRDLILDAVRRSDQLRLRFARTLDRMTDHGLLSRDQRDAIVAALHTADWDGFSIERLGDILARLVKDGTLTARERDMLLDGTRR